MNGWIRPLVAFSTLIHVSFNFLFPHFALAQTVQKYSMSFPYSQELMAEYHARKERLALLERLKYEGTVRYHIVTAYSSTVDQTDGDPFTTASGTKVRDGIVAANTLPFGSKIMMPDLFGDKVFTVEDRMAAKNWHKVDVWFPTRQEARQFGVKKAKIIVIPQELSENI